MRTREEPFAWVRDEVFRLIGLQSEGLRFEGRVGGDWVRCACRRAEGDMRGMAEGGIV